MQNEIRVLPQQSRFNLEERLNRPCDIFWMSQDNVPEMQKHFTGLTQAQGPGQILHCKIWVKENSPKNMRQHTTILNSFFLVLCGVLISVNVFQLFQKLTPDQPVAFAGLKFSGLGDKLKEESTVGYATDRDIKEPGPLAEYQQAQYVLAPVLLDIQQPSRHRYVLVNCSDDAAAIKKLKELNARPLLRNQFGVILAEINGSRTAQPNQGGS